MKKELLKNIGVIFFAASFLFMTSIVSVASLASTVDDDTTAIMGSSNENNIRITEQELPFEISTYKSDDSHIYLVFSDEVRENVMVKDMKTGEELSHRNGIYILNIGEKYYYSVSINSLIKAEYYGAFFEVTTDEVDYITYSEIIKNVVMSDTTNIGQNITMASAEYEEAEPANNTVSGAVVTYSDADGRGSISTSGDADWWKIKFNYDGKANFWLGEIPDGCNYVLSIYNTPGTSQLRSSNNSGNIAELITIDVIKDVYYTIKITSSSGSSASEYLLRVKNYPRFTGNDVYTIRNNGFSGKYLAVENGYNANLQNVMLDTEKSETSTSFTNNQRMRLNYHTSKDAYTISPICSYNGHGRALDVYNTGTISNGANVQTWKAQDVENQIFANEQYFTFEESGSGVVIRMKYFTDFVLAGNSTNNVFISTYSDSSNTQRWTLIEDINYNNMEDLYKSYNWGWMYFSGNTPVSLNFSSSYGKRFYNNSDEAHYALDIPADNEDPVYSISDGVVTQVGYKTGIEYFVVVETEDAVYNNASTNLRVLYQHMLEEPKVVKEEQVTQKIDQIGITGMGHMHFCVITDGCNRLEASDFSDISNSTRWHTQYFYNTTNPLLFYDWDGYGFTYN